MRIPKQTDYKLIVLLSLAEAGEVSVPLRQIATRYDLPLPFLRAIASQLVHQGLISSQEGASGGYRLAKPSAEISLADVLMGETGLLEALPCRITSTVCQRQGDCIAEASWEKLEAKVGDILRAIPLSEVAA